MKLNAAVEGDSGFLPEFNRSIRLRHAPNTRVPKALFQQLEDWLAEMNRFCRNLPSAQRRLAGGIGGLLVIRASTPTKGKRQRRICLSRPSAHGTNPASAVMAGFRVMPVPAITGEYRCHRFAERKLKPTKRSCSANGHISVQPTGVFEESIQEICESSRPTRSVYDGLI